MHCLLKFAQVVKIKRVLVAEALHPAQTFWYFVTGATTDIATIEWCKVFGSHGDDTHWTRVLPPKEHDRTRQDLLTTVKLDQEKWEQYRDSVVRYRNQLGAHHDLDANVDKFPHFDHALLAAYFMYERFYNLLPENELGGLPQSLERWSDTVIGNITPIIKKAFAGSAPLGSNMRRS
jgi:hypothetical protein